MNNQTMRGVMLLTLLLLSILRAVAQPLTVSNNVLRFACDYGAELYASADLRYWERTRIFTNETALPTNGAARFYRAKSRTRPVRLVMVVDTNQTVRGHADKDLTNIVATGEGGTYRGWVEYTQPPIYCFRLPPMPGNTNVTLTLFDVDGFQLMTNLVIDPTTPSTNRFKPAKRARRRQGSGINPDPPTAPSEKRGSVGSTMSLLEWSNLTSIAKY